LYNGVVIISKGLIFGNLIGLGFYFSQKLLGWIRLDPLTYFVEVAPVSLSSFEVLFINLFFLFIFTLLLWLPSRIILRISPSKVLRLK
jgi:lipoprotein-releasing system permease protein